jgi:DNA-binding transcriptional LysR family regulator
MNLRQIEVFRAVMLAGSISGAASSLHVSSPGISRLLRHLELRLRVSLFERRKGRLVPTPEAQALHAEIERVYQGVRQVQSLAASLHGGGRAVLRVLASANAALQLVPLAVAAVVARHPGAKVYFETLPTAEIVRRLLAEEADVAVCSASIEHPSLDVHDVGHWSLVCALPRGHRLARSRALSAAELDEVLQGPLVVYHPEAPQSAAIGAWLARHDTPVNAVAEVRSGFAACSLAAAGVGVAFVDDLSARAHRADGLVLRNLPGAPRYPIRTVVNANRPPSQLGKTFLADIQARLRG